jgi:putative nucleotidyltransferase with HDIG domain
MRLGFDLGERKGDRGGISVSRQRIDPGAAGITQTQQLGDFVEGLAGCVVERGAHVPVAFAMGDIEVGVAAGNHQSQSSGTRIEGFTLSQQNGMNVALKVVHRDQRFLQGESQRLGVSDSHQQRARQAGALGDRDGIEISKADSRLGHRRANYGNDITQMFARGEFRNHPAVRCMDGDLRGHDARANVTSALYDGRGGLVTRAFDTENHFSIVVDMQGNPAHSAAAGIVARLRAAGYRAYFVGGCVRDLLLGREPKDFDVATGAPPDKVLTLFEKTFAVGAHFGVVLVASGEIVTEVATFRNDGAYSDGRRPDEVRFSTSPEEDAKRRDFTINGMMLDPVNGAVLDVVGGRRDLQAGLIRAIGDPGERFAEDKLRMLRAVRFAARFAFALDPATAKAVQRLAPDVIQVSRERVRDELTRMLTEGRARLAFELLDSTGLLSQVLPEVVRMQGVAQPPQYHPEGDVWVHTLLLLEGLPAGCPMTLAWAALLHDVGKPATFRVAPDRIRFDGHVEAGLCIAQDICRRLRFPNHETDQILALIANHMRFADVRKMKESTLKRFFRLEHFDQHLALHRLDCLASHGSLELYDFARERFETLPEEQVRPTLLVSGKDLIQAGYRPGPQFSKMLALAEDAQLEGTVRTREQALALIQDRWPDYST